MGAGVHLPRALIGALAVSSAACIDFVEPTIPALGAPAVLQTRLVLDENGALALVGQLEPGLDHAGFRRLVEHDEIQVHDQRIAPERIRNSGARIYNATLMLDPLENTRRVVVVAPAVTGIQAVPAFDWYGVRRVGPDSLRMVPGGDLALVLDSDLGTPEPAPGIRQWFLTIAGDSTTFRLGGDGLPPDTILVPARWIPPGDSLAVRLIFSQSASVTPPPGDYVGIFALDTRLFWTVRMDTATRVGTSP